MERMWQAIIDEARRDPVFISKVCLVQWYSTAKVLDDCGFPESLREFERFVEEQTAL